jgi:pyruvate dehydrogenase E2 component (dihydrolipoamide acetyltransferase)
MAYVLIMPRQGNTVESCILVDWSVKEGDAVSADMTVCVVETDKATFEVPAGEAGMVLKLLHAAGDDVPVLEPIAVIGQSGENWEAALGSGPGPKAAGEAEAPETTAPSGPAPSGAGAVSETPATTRAAEGARASPRARNLAVKENIALDFSGSGPGGRIIERDVLAALEGRPALSVAAKASAAAVTALPALGSGLGGRVTTADLAVVTAAPAVSLTAAAGVTAGTQVLELPDLGAGAVVETPIKGVRKLIADRMFQSLAESAQFTLNASAPVRRMQSLRERMKASAEDLGLSKITVNDLILFVVSRLLPRFPFMNAHKTGDTLKTFERVHLGVAVDTPRGLMVPVIRNANLLSLRQISSEAKRLAGACQKGNVKPEELTGSTFTVTNLGSLGITGFTPVLNAPEVAILGVCGIELKPAAVCPAEGASPFEPHIGFSLTINHQVVDGAPAARFLKALGEAVADIDLWLV